MRNAKFILFAMICLLGQEIFAQADIESIKKSLLYYSAEGEGVTKEEAQQDALGQISRQIISVVYDESSEIGRTVTQVSGNGENSSSTIDQTNVVNIVSSVSLRNVEIRELSPEPEAKVFCWVRRSDVQRMFEQRKTKILDYVKSGNIAEKALQIDDAVRYYYWALMLSATHPDPVRMEYDGDSVDVQTFMPLKIKQVLSGIRTTVESIDEADNRHYANVRFEYNGHKVSSVQLKYNDGQSFVGPLAVRDGMGEFELLSFPPSGSVDFFYEYTFRKEGENLDKDLAAAFQYTKKRPIIINEAKSTLSLGKPKRGTAKKAELQVATNSVATFATASGRAVKPEEVTVKPTIDMHVVKEDKEYRNVMKEIEKAIKAKDPKLAYQYFTVDGYHMFETLVSKTGTVSLVGSKQNYDFIETPGRVIARFCKVSVKFKNGRKFMENLVFRFNEEKKIESLAFALTNKAEADIFNADASMWKEVSRYAILQFMEDYQTAYTLKRLDYIDRIFSDDAIIIVGSMIKKAPEEVTEGRSIDLGNKDVAYTQRTKAEYLGNLKTIFQDQEFVHLTFENNELRLVNAPYRETGTVFAIQIRQLYNSPQYSDQGYLTLVFDASKELPLIGVRLWQPDKTEMVKIQDFVKKFKF